MSSEHHRRAHPDDARLFAPAMHPKLARAAEEVAWLLGRGWSMSTAAQAVVAHHQLETRQRLALSRVCCSDAQRDARRARSLPPQAARAQTLKIDGFNLVVTLEVALGGGLVLIGRDGAVRDLAGLRGSWHPMADTDAVLEHVGAVLTRLAPAKTEWLLDAPMSNSGRLRARIVEHAARWPFACDVTLVPDPDPLLAATDYVVSADAAILERCASWLNLSAWVLEACVPDAWCLAL